jgi:hypothetical protein
MLCLFVQRARAGIVPVREGNGRSCFPFILVWRRRSKSVAADWMESIGGFEMSRLSAYPVDAPRIGGSAGRGMARTSPHVALAGILALSAMALPVPPAWAGTCLEQVDAMAETYQLHVDPPNIGKPGPGEGPRDLGKSGGVIEPPKVDDPAVIKPPPGVRYGMPTLPDVAPNGPPSTPPNGTKETLGAKDLAILESILVAARDEAQRGEEAACFRKLQTAQEFLKNRK